MKSPTKQDDDRLSRVMKYLLSTSKLILGLQADNMNIIKWWIDASFAVHFDMKNHTGGTMLLGTGDIYSSSSKQKLNTKSSTESELVGMDDILPQALWKNMFLYIRVMIQHL